MSPESEPRPTETVIESPVQDTPEDLRVAELLARAEVDDVLNVAEFAEAVGQQEAADAADTLESLEEDQAVDVIEEMDEAAAADALVHMDVSLAVSVLEDLLEEDVNLAGRLVGAMEPDDAADLLGALPEPDRNRLLKLLPREQALSLRDLLRYDPDTAGGMMTTDYLSLRETMTVEQATAHIRASTVDEDMQHAFVVDGQNRLVGIVSLRRLLIARGGERIADIIDREVDAIPPDLDREEVAREFAKYDFPVLPVVGPDRRLLGLVTVDDVIDIIRAEEAEDAQLMFGAGAEEGVYSTIGEKLRGRFPWLLVNLLTSSVAAIIVLQFDDLIGELAFLAVLMPVIANQAGNAGQQSLAVTLRGIVLDEVRVGRVRSLLVREATVGAVNGILAGLIVGGVVAAIEMTIGHHTWRLGIVAGTAMSVALTVGCFIGSAMPVVMKRAGFDPATASTIFLTMITDSGSFFIFLGLSRLLWSWMTAGMVPA
ncbi:MAG: magnesium transporter [Phycisphaerales bacterium]|nr:magnesium transporter [Phycisphaerales bacterium]